MIDGENTRRKLHITIKGMTGEKSFTGDWASMEDSYDASLPDIGDIWSEAYPLLKCVDISSDEMDGGLGILVAQYSTERQLAESFVDIEKSFESEPSPQMKGWVWDTTGTPVEIDLPNTIAITVWRMTVKESTPPDAAIRAAQDCVNSAEFFGVPVGCMRFKGATQNQSYGKTGDIVSVSVTYTFVERGVPHNQFYREPLAVKTKNQTQFYQSDNADAPNYTTDATLIGTKVYVSGAAGKGAWDTPQDPDNSNAPRFASCDFATVLGLPG